MAKPTLSEVWQFLFFVVVDVAYCDPLGRLIVVFFVASADASKLHLIDGHWKSLSFSGQRRKSDNLKLVIAILTYLDDLDSVGLATDKLENIVPDLDDSTSCFESVPTRQNQGDDFLALRIVAKKLVTPFVCYRKVKVPSTMGSERLLDDSATD